MKILQRLYCIFPNFIQNIFITWFNIMAYKKRYGGKYKYYKKMFFNNRNLSKEELLKIQKNRYVAFLKLTVLKSEYYKKNLLKIEDFNKIETIEKLPFLSKEILRSNVDKINTITKNKGIISKTGGTTGKSLEVLFTHDNMQERFAMLDDFRDRQGYKLGERTAWFSGKSILTSRDLKKCRYWKTDYFYRVRYYSTFHIHHHNLIYYIKDLIKFRPKFFVGFPSTMFDIAKYGINNGLQFPNGMLKAIFPTAETINKEMREVIESYFHCKMYNQYASSEGAPFIFECKYGILHLELQSGVFEVLDEYNNPSQSGRLVVTSFTSEGTPLIRYDIGDSITLEDESKSCQCGNNNPLVKEILGRIDDFIYSPEVGKINLGNVSNTLKDTKGILKFQAIQNSLSKLILKIVIDKKIYNKKIEKNFIQNWRDRIGNSMELEVQYVDDISVEQSGKFRLVKNNIKHLLNV
ncbi:phenylacetate--CoA ligase family protein [Aequorivita sp. F47161]|uniref:Phenylacetate--CoA ligase family protein n=1 Tax=Aequorivita vitellina TaxID=2874475 RepID=A0A9X1QYL9_9FLAO|nr:phenylacetate--CoA ligase family protein [Aequorivita vitellina]MCG2419772.1 phenylacetate--CoA ligase family protein [Aequorivita vitellina]